MAKKPEQMAHWWNEPELSRYLESNNWFRWWWEGENDEKGMGWHSAAELRAIQFAFFLYEADARFEGKYRFGAPVPELNFGAMSMLWLPFSPGHRGSGYDYDLPGIPQWRELLSYEVGPPIHLQDDRVSISPELFSKPVIFVGRKTGRQCTRSVSFNFSHSDRQIREALVRRRHHFGLPEEISINAVMRYVRAHRKAFKGKVFKAPRVVKKLRRHDVPWHWLEWMDTRAKAERDVDWSKMPDKKTEASRISELFRLRNDVIKGGGQEWLSMGKMDCKNWRFTNT